jgi:hypothetical protein
MVMSRSLTVGDARRGRGRAETLDDGRSGRKARTAARAVGANVETRGVSYVTDKNPIEAQGSLGLDRL